MRTLIRALVPEFLRPFLRRVFNVGYGLIATFYLKNIWIVIHPPVIVKKEKSSCVPATYFFPGMQDKNRTLSALDANFPNSISSAIRSADRICSHVFDLLGSGPKFLGHEINWHTDFKVNHAWPLVHPRCIDVEDLNKSSDVKVPWELSRCHHFITLGQAYWLTGDEKYVKEFKSQVVSWINSNPYGLGVNWLSTMDVAMRVANWITAWQFFKKHLESDVMFCDKFYSSIYVHGRHIIRNPENEGSMTSNHYLANIVGLLYVAITFPWFNKSSSWQQFAIAELKRELMVQVNPDGMDFEGSTCYHRLVLELFFYATLLTVVNDGSHIDNFELRARKIFGNEYVDRLRKMFEFVLYVLKSNGNMSQIGDNDSGRLHIFSERGILDMRYLLSLGAIFFNDSMFKIDSFGIGEDALWIFGEEGCKRWQTLKGASLKTIKSKAFRDSGIYVMRDERNYIMISVMEAGQNGLGRHSHNDVLGFELTLDGDDIIIDPGTYSYTGNPKLRNIFRSSAFHNAVVVDGEEINQFNERTIFRMANEAKPKVLRWETNDNYDILEAEHCGFARLRNPVIHNREILYDKITKRIKIKDRFKGSGRHSLQWNLILSPTLRMHLNIRSKELKWQEGEAFYSCEYGVFKKTKKLTAVVKTTVPKEYEFEIII